MKYKSIKDFSTNDWGKMAVTGLLAGVIAPGTVELARILLELASLLGLISFVIWIYRKIKKLA